MARRYCYNDVAPLIAMVTAVCTNVGVNILFKEATSKGMNQYIFITYSYVVAALVLLPLSFIFPRRATVPLLKYFYLGSRLFLLGLIGFLAQICAYKGIADSSPTLASAMSNLGPAFTFILAVLFRYSILDFGVVCDHDGFWISGFTRNIRRCSATMAEIWSILDGLQIAWSLDMKNVILETDSKKVIQEIQATGEKWDCSLVI